MKNLLFASSYTGLGGGETWILTLAGHLDAARWRPHLLLPGEGELAAAWRAQGWPVHVLPYRGATTWFLPALWARLPLTGQIAALLQAEQIDIVHSDYHSLPWALPAAKDCGLPLMWTCMGWWFRARPWQRAFFRQIDAIFAHSYAIKRGFLGEPPFLPPRRVEVLYPGVDTERFHPDVDGGPLRAEVGIPQDAPLVAMLGRFQNVKGHDTFQAVARQVLIQVPEAWFIVAGADAVTAADRRYRERILRQAGQDRLLRDRLLYLGFRRDTEAVIAAADVVVCPSRFESYGVANIEAMAGGRPVVSTERGGPSETIIHGETGYLVAPQDVAAYASHIITLLRDPELRARMGAAGRERALRKFSAVGNAARFTQVLERLLGPGEEKP